MRKIISGKYWYDDFSTDRSSEYIKVGTGSFTIDTANKYVKLSGDVGILPNVPGASDIVIEVEGMRVSSAGGDAWLAIMARRGSINQLNWYNFQKKVTTSEFWIVKRVNGSEVFLASIPYGPVADDVFHYIKVKAMGSNLSWKFSDSPWLTASDSSYPSGYFGLSAYAGEVRYKNFKAYRSEEIRVTTLNENDLVELLDQNNNVITSAYADRRGIVVIDISNLAVRPPYKLRINNNIIDDVWGGDVYGEFVDETIKITANNFTPVVKSFSFSEVPLSAFNTNIFQAKGVKTETKELEKMYGSYENFKVFSPIPSLPPTREISILANFAPVVKNFNFSEVPIKEFKRDQDIGVQTLFKGIYIDVSKVS